MPELLEDELTRLFADAGSTLDTPPDLASRAEARYRGRRGRRTVLGAVTIIAILTAIATTLPHLNRGPATTAAPTAKSSAGPSASGPPQEPPLKVPTSTNGLSGPEKVWPGQIGFVPHRAPGGGSYAVQAVLDPDTVAVTWESSLQHPTKLFAYNVRDGKSTLLADLRGPSRVSEYFPQTFATNNSSIFWWALGISNGHQTTYVWSVARTGGTPRLLTSFAGKDDGSADLSDLAADESHVYWTGGGQIRRLAATGGPVEDVPGLAGYVLRGFPWAMNYSRHTLHNVITSEEIPILLSGNIPFCQPTFCYGRIGTESGFVVRPDGTGKVDVSGFEYSSDQIIDNHLALAYVPAEKVIALIDVTTGKAAVVPGEGASPLRGGTIFWLKGDGFQLFLPAR